MTEHAHATLVDGCYRCDLNRDEMPGPHECDSTRLDWSDCELCGIRHAYCSVCDEIHDDCEVSR